MVNYDKIRNSTFLITGATGMLGQNLIDVLFDLNIGIRVLANVRSEEKANKVFGKFLYNSNFKMVVSDITELCIEDEVDYIIHTAGVTGGSKQHIDNPLRTINVAIAGTKRVLDIAVEKNCKGFIYLSSLEVYGKNPDTVEEVYEDTFGFLDPMSVRSSYSESKRMCENICASYLKQYNLPTYVARLTATFGNAVDYKDNRVFAQFARSVINKEDIILKSTGGTIRNYCDAEDAAYAFLAILTNGIPGEAYNVSNMETEISIKELALKFIELFPSAGTQLKFDLSMDPTLLGYNKEMKNVLNSEKLIKLGWEPRFSLEETIKKLVNSMSSSKE